MNQTQKNALIRLAALSICVIPLGCCKTEWGKEYYSILFRYTIDKRKKPALSVRLRNHESK